MELVKDVKDVNDLKVNQVIGNPNLINTIIQFNGINNLLVCEGDIKLVNSKLVFQGNNNVIYLSYTKHNYNLNIFIRSNSTLFIGKNNELGTGIDINIQEHQNVVIGDDGIIGNRVTIRTCDAHAVYDQSTKQRINFSGSIFIGDHVWIDHFTYISRDVKIGSGAVVNINSVIPPSAKIHSNSQVMGNPISLVHNSIFFTKDFTGNYTSDDSLKFSSNDTELFNFKFVNNETLSLDQIDKILKGLSVDDRLEFIEKLFIKNKRKNRFYY